MKKEIVFDEADLFPLINASEHDYEDAQIHAQKVDQFLGFRIDEIEKQLVTETRDADQVKEMWIGLKPKALQTPYSEIRTLLKTLSITNHTVVDLGAAYGRMGLVMNAHNGGASFIGFEISKARVDEGNRIYRAQKVKNARLIWADLAIDDFKLPEAEVYFIYDFGTLRSIQKVLSRLREIALNHPVIVVGRGRRVRDEVERHEPWLSAMVQPEHYEHFSIYRTHS